MHDRDGEGLEQLIMRLRAPAPNEAAAQQRVVAAVTARLGLRRPWWRRPATVARAAVLTSLAAAASLIVAVIGRQGGPQGHAAQDPSPIALPAAAHPAFTTVAFSLADASARQVALVGDFNDWSADATPLVRTGDGPWRVAVALPPGRHAYAFVVDGVRWTADPLSPLTEKSDLGQPTSVLYVGEAPAR
jgi:hypothetical protein